ncbi:hypothetical protein PSPO01_15362 [Paraphaeosphaeria sporulosa]
MNTNQPTKKEPGRLQDDERGEHAAAAAKAFDTGLHSQASPQDTTSLGKPSKKREQTSNATPGLTSAEQAMSSELKGPKNAMLKELSVVASVQGAFEKTEDHLRGLHRATAVIRETSAQLSNRPVGV